MGDPESGEGLETDFSRLLADHHPIGARAAWDLCPEGAATHQPRATPWDHEEFPPPRALEGRHKTPGAGVPVSPFQGTDPGLRPVLVPGRCPGLMCYGPVGANLVVIREESPFFLSQPRHELRRESSPLPGSSRPENARVASYSMRGACVHLSGPERVVVGLSSHRAHPPAWTNHKPQRTPPPPRACRSDSRSGSRATGRVLRRGRMVEHQYRPAPPDPAGETGWNDWGDGVRRRLRRRAGARVSRLG